MIAVINFKRIREFCILLKLSGSHSIGHLPGGIFHRPRVHAGRVDSPDRVVYEHYWSDTIQLQ